MMSFAPVINAQEKLAGSKGEPCMVVVDPMTRKLLIPCDSILPTRAQQRPTIPSLCQLFLVGRCRQGANCHQVHAPLDVVKPLRDEVTSLPMCCPQHGDVDHAGVLDAAAGLSNAFLHLPESTYNKGYIPLCLVSYTIPVSKLLNELAADTRAVVERHRQAAVTGQTLDDTPPLVCLEAGSIPICRLHATSRCHYAEECSFLHLCKKVTEQDPQLPLGRRSRIVKTLQKSPLLSSSIDAVPHVQSRILTSNIIINSSSSSNNNNNIHNSNNNNNNNNNNKNNAVHHTVAAMRRPIGHYSPPTPHVRPPCVRGYALTRSQCGVGGGLGSYTAFAALHNMPREQQHILQQHFQQQQQQQQQIQQIQQGSVLCGDMNTPLRRKLVERSPHATRFSCSMSHSMECGSVMEFKSAAESSHMWTATSAAAAAAITNITTNNTANSVNNMTAAAATAAHNNNNNIHNTTTTVTTEIKVHSSPVSVHTSLSDSMGMGSRDEGLSSSPLNLSGSRSSGGRSWRHNPYGFNALKAVRMDA